MKLTIVIDLDKFAEGAELAEIENLLLELMDWLPCPLAETSSAINLYYNQQWCGDARITAK